MLRRCVRVCVHVHVCAGASIYSYEARAMARALHAPGKCTPLALVCWRAPRVISAPIQPWPLAEWLYSARFHLKGCVRTRALENAVRVGLVPQAQAFGNLGGLRPHGLVGDAHFASYELLVVAGLACLAPLVSTALRVERSPRTFRRSLGWGWEYPLLENPLEGTSVEGAIGVV